MSDRRSAGHHICIKAMRVVAGQLEQPGCASDEGVEPHARFIIGEARAIVSAFKREDRLQLPSKIERRFGCDLVSTIGNWRDKAQLGLKPCKAVTLGRKQLASRFLDLPEHVADALPKHGYAALGQDLSPMTRDSDRKNERNRRWASSGRSFRDLDCCGGSVQPLSLDALLMTIGPQ